MLLFWFNLFLEARVEIQKYFRSFFVHMKTLKSPFEINWHLAIAKAFARFTIHSTKIAGSSILSSLQQDLLSLLQLPSLWTKVAMWRNYRENLWISRYFLCALFFFGWSLVYFTTITRTTITMGRKPFWNHFLNISCCFDMASSSILDSVPLWNIWSNQNVSSKSSNIWNKTLL